MLSEKQDSETSTEEVDEGLAFSIDSDFPERDGYSLAGYSGTSTVVKVPSCYKGLPVKRITHYESHCEQRYELILPESVYSIGSSAFEGDKKIKKITLQGSLSYLSDCAFRGMSVEEIHISDTASQMQASVPIDSLVKLTGGLKIEAISGFSSCKSLREVPVFPNLKSFLWNSFCYDPQLEEFTIPEGMTSIDKILFYESGVKKIHLPSTLTKITQSFCEYCPLEKIEVAPGNPNFCVRQGCLFEDGGETLFIAPRAPGVTFEIPSGTEKIHSLALAHSNYEKILIPSGVVSLGESAFWDCKKIREISVPSTVRTIFDGCFKDCSSLQTVSFQEPSSVSKIKAQAFAGCKSLKSFAFPDKVKEIPENVFQGCANLSFVILPRLVQEIDCAAFDDCPSLKALLYPGSKSVFDKVDIDGYKIFTTKKMVSFYSEKKPTDMLARYWHFGKDGSNPVFWN
jgi:hypothetical protein